MSDSSYLGTWNENFSSPSAAADGLAALCDPSKNEWLAPGAAALPPYVVLDRFDEPVWLFDSLESAIQFVVESWDLGFRHDVLTHTGKLTAEQKRSAREVLRG